MRKNLLSVIYILFLLFLGVTVLYPIGRTQIAIAQEINTDSQTPVDQIIIERFNQNLKKQIPEFINDIPETIKNIALIKIEGASSLLQQTRVFQKVMLTFHQLDRFEIIDCPECQKQVAYTKNGKLFFAPLIETSAQFQNLKNTHNIDAYLKGILEYDAKTKRLVLLLQMFQTEDGRLVKLSTIESDEKKRTEETLAPSKLEWSIEFTPYTNGFVTSSTDDQQITTYLGGSLRVVGFSLSPDTKVGVDFGAIIPTPSSEFEGVRSILIFLPFIQYHAPWVWEKKRIFKAIFGLGMASVGDTSTLVGKLGTDVSISYPISLGIGYYNIPETIYEGEDENEITFTGSGVALHLRYIF